MKLLSLLALLPLLFQGTLGMNVTNAISNSRPRLGENITISCNIAGGTTGSVKWWKDKHRSPGAVLLSYICVVVGEEYKSRLRNVQCDRNNFDFQLSNVQISDHGDWMCEADGEEATTKLRLDILVPPLTPTVKNPSPVNVGDTAKLTCNAENENVTKPVTYTWTKNGKTPPVGNSSRLLITPVTMGHAGKYVCVAKNDAGSKTSTEQDFVVNSPSTPTNLEVVNSTPTNPEVVNSTAVATTPSSWTSESNGGYERSKTSPSVTNPTSDIASGQTPVVVVAVVGLAVAVILAITLITVVVVWKRGVVRWGKRQSQRPINDILDNINTVAEFTTTGHGSAEIYDIIGTEHVNGAFCSESKADRIPAMPWVAWQHVQEHGIEPLALDYEYVDVNRSKTQKQDVPDQSNVPTHQVNKTEPVYASVNKEKRKLDPISTNNVSRFLAEGDSTDAAKPKVTLRHIYANEFPENGPEFQADNAYDLEMATVWQQGCPGPEGATARQAAYSTPYEQFWQNVSHEEQTRKEGQESDDYDYIHLPTIWQAEQEAEYIDVRNVQQGNHD